MSLKNKNFCKNKSVFIKKRNIRIAIIGGGIGGCMSALVIAKKFPDVEITIFEKNKELLSGTSNCTPGRMGLGFHYVHSQSAVTYLRQTLDFVKHFSRLCPNLMVGQEFLIDHFLRNGRYFIVKNSAVPTTQILDTYGKVADEYAELVKRDKTNKIFGEPDNFYRILKPKEYKNDVELKNIDTAIETHEHLLNWLSFKKFILNEIASCKNINILIGKKIQDISYAYMESLYVIHRRKKASSGRLIGKHYAEFIINATWEWVDYFNTKIGYYRLPNEVRTNRAKALIKIKLPDELKEKNSMFFCMGPHCMFSNLGNGEGLITYAPETNIQNSTALIPEKSYVSLISGHVSEKNKAQLAQKIINGVSQYIPAMSKAKIVEVRFGTVQVEGEANIFDHSSKIYERDYMGLKYLEDGFISLSCTKLLYGYGNANTAANLFSRFKDEMLPAAQYIEDFTRKKFVSEPDTKEKNKDVKVSLLSGLCFAWFKKSRSIQNKSSNIGLIEDFCLSFFKKTTLNKEFKANYSSLKLQVY